ncbi:unnamed protein product [Fraxinus pennsylvanica]|uniref:Uncharacterized protein n=1 Tax=Fraxinus pennsylvanica TaxID=56036 RepID=A0AAD1YT22_9LAMI|nr:unnamed protein product [Fraxinus pennsylvanica]
MPRVPRLQDEEDNDWIENGYKDTDGSLSAMIMMDLIVEKRVPTTVLMLVQMKLEEFLLLANLKAYLGGSYPTFSLVPVDTKNFLWERFQHEKLGKPTCIPSKQRRMRLRRQQVTNCVGVQSSPD